MGDRKSFKTAMMLATGIFLCLLLTIPGFTADEFMNLDSAFLDEVNMIRGELVTLKVKALTRVSITDPAVADIADATDDEILLVGQREGRTALFIWDEYGKRTIMVYVYDQDLNLVKSRVANVLKVADIHEVKLTINEQEGKVFVTGEVPEEKMNRFGEVITSFSNIVVDLSEEEVIEDLVQIDRHITEMSTAVTKRLGIDWFTGTGTTDSDGNITTSSSGGFTPVYGELFPSLEPGIGDLLKVGKIQRTTNSAFIAQVNALIIEGKARILSKPKLVVISGEEASFLVGGEVPIRTTTISSSGGSQEDVSFKTYGIAMTIIPTIKREKIDIVMNLEISEIDAATASTISDDIAFSTRSTSTHLFLDNDQMIILAGLIKKSESDIERRIPFLSRVPIMGALFRSKANPVPETELELVIALTPHILRQKESLTEVGDHSGSMKQELGAERQAYRKTVPHYLGIPKEMTEYVSDVQRKISQSIMYPQEARQYGWEGTVKLGVLILNDGTLAFALVKESSGHDIFDEGALNTTKRLAPFSAFPPDTDLQELNMTIPIIYSLSQR